MKHQVVHGTLNSEGEILLTLISAVAQNESLSLSENVKWGLHRKYESGSVKSVHVESFSAVIKSVVSW